MIRYYKMTTYNWCLANETENRKCHSPSWSHFRRHTFSLENGVMCCCHSFCMDWCLALPMIIFAGWMRYAVPHDWQLQGQLKANSCLFICTSICFFPSGVAWECLSAINRRHMCKSCSHYALNLKRAFYVLVPLQFKLTFIVITKAYLSFYLQFSQNL